MYSVSKVLLSQCNLILQIQDLQQHPPLIKCPPQARIAELTSADPIVTNYHSVRWLPQARPRFLPPKVSKLKCPYPFSLQANANTRPCNPFPAYHCIFTLHKQLSFCRCNIKIPNCCLAILCSAVHAHKYTFTNSYLPICWMLKMPQSFFLAWVLSTLRLLVLIAWIS